MGVSCASALAFLDFVGFLVFSFYFYLLLFLYAFYYYFCYHYFYTYFIYKLHCSRRRIATLHLFSSLHSHPMMLPCSPQSPESLSNMFQIY